MDPFWRAAPGTFEPLASLGVDDYGSIGQAEAAQIIDDSASYFGRRPYKWFTPLDRILQDALGVWYFNGTACHLDLVQWATKPLWGELDQVARASTTRSTIALSSSNN